MALWASESTEGIVVSVEKWTLQIRSANGDMLSFNPYWKLQGKVSTPSRPALTMLPALEFGELVRVTWTQDTKEDRKRIDSIEVLSAHEGTTKGTVVTAKSDQLVINPKDKPGAVTLNPSYVRVDKKFVPDPAIARKLAQLKPGAQVTVQWAWDKEDRKRVMGITNGW